MEIKFVDDSEVPVKGRGGTLPTAIAPLLRELVNHPNKWAVYPERVNEGPVSYLRKKFPQYQFAHTGKTRTLYVRYTPPNLA